LSGRIFVARESFVCDYDGRRVSIVRGRTRVREGHPIMQGREHKFEPLTVDYDIEEATARPGARRGARRGGGRKPPTVAGEQAPESVDASG